MNVRNCRSCGKIFNYIAGAPVCPACRDALEEKFQAVKKYIQENPGVGISHVSEACEVEASQIRQWVREERLEFAEGGSVDLACEKCGVAIRTGRFCPKCKASTINSMNNMFQRPTQQAAPTQDRNAARMRFIDK